MVEPTVHPRLIYYSDAHHFHAKRLDPPVSHHRLQWPIHELLGTGVELLVFGLGFGDVYFHQTKYGRVVGDEQEVWSEFINWRIMRMVKDAAEMGTDQVREVITRGRETGLPVFPSLKLQDPAEPGDQRCGWLKWHRGQEVAHRVSSSRFPSHKTEWCLDYTNELVREEKLALIRELLEDYSTDGIELDFMFFPLYFRESETEANVDTMSRFVADVKSLANEIGHTQDRSIQVAARVAHRREENIRMGLDVESWIANGSVDMIIGQIPNMLLDTGVTDGKWMADSANQVGIASYLRPNRRLDDPRASIATAEMFRAFGQTLHWQGFTGMYLGYLPWPFAHEEYQLLREMAYPESFQRRNKRYILPPTEALAPYQIPDNHMIPLTLKEGERESLPIIVTDHFSSAQADGELRSPVLTLRFQSFCVEDDVQLDFNGTNLPVDRKNIYEPQRGTYWLRYILDPGVIVQGENILSIEVTRMEPTAGFARLLTGVEINVRYTEFERPESLNPATIPPPS